MDIQLCVQPGVRDMALVTLWGDSNPCCHLCHAAGLGMLMDGCAEPQSAPGPKGEKGIKIPVQLCSSAMALGRWKKEVFSLG